MRSDYLQVFSVVVIDDSKDYVHVDKITDHQKHYKEDHIVS